MIDLTTIFYQIDEFCKKFNHQVKKNTLSAGKNIRNRTIKLTQSEVMTISIWYHFSGYKDFKNYYEKHVLVYLKREFPGLVSYSRFIELRKIIIKPMIVFLITTMGSCTGKSFIDSFRLISCHAKRQSSHKTLKAISAKGKTSTGWFYGTKVHLIFNDKGEIISLSISPGNISDNNEQLLLKITKDIKGKLFGDKGYIINPKLFEKLYLKGLQIVTKIRANMKNKLMDMDDKLALRKRGFAESIGDILKEHLNLEHTRHRSIWGFFLNIFSCLVAYQMREKKPQLSVRIDESLITA